MKTKYFNLQILQKTFFFFLAVSAILLTSCSDKDEYTSRGDLFEPRFINDPICTVDSDNAAIAWYQVNAAKSYTVRLYTDNYYTSLFREYTTENPYIYIQDVPFSSTFYVKVRSNAEDSIHDSRWATTSFVSTKRGPYAQLLQDVSKTEITDSTVIIRWTVDPGNPVDSISVVPTMNKNIASICRYLNAGEKTAGTCTLTGLTRNSMYTVNIYDTSKPRTYDKPYNEITFKTTGPAAKVIHVGLIDDLSALLNANNNDSDIPEGTEYMLLPGTTYTISPFSIRKGFRIVGASGGEKPILILNGSFKFADETYISSLEFNNVEIRNAASGQYFLNDGNSYTAEQINMTNCTFRNIMRGFWRHQGANKKTIKNFDIEGCWFDQCGWQSGCYGMFYLGSAGKSAVQTLDIINNLTIKDCTFSRGGYDQNTKYGWGNLIYDNMSDAPMNLTIQNVTFYNYCVNKRLVDLSNAAGSSLTIKNILLASPCGEIYKIASETTTGFSNNYTTSDYVLGGSKIEATDLPQSASDIFQDPEKGNYTIKDKNSIIYKKRIGDTRWIK